MRVIVGRGYIENNHFHFDKNVVSMHHDEDFSSMLMNVSSRLVEAILIKLDPLGITLENIEQRQVKVKHEGVASEDFIEANIEYLSKRTEKSYRRIMGYLTLLCEMSKSNNEEVAEAVIIARFLLNSWRSGLISEDEFTLREKTVTKFMRERTAESIVNGERPVSTLVAKNQEATSVIFDVEKVLEEVLEQSEEDVFVQDGVIFTAILSHWIKYKLSPSPLQDDLLAEVDVSGCSFVWEDNKSTKYRVNSYKESKSSQVCLRKVLPTKSLMNWSDLSILADL